MPADNPNPNPWAAPSGCRGTRAASPMRSRKLSRPYDFDKSYWDQRAQMSAGFRQGLRRMPWVMDPLTQLSSGYPFFFPQTPEQNKALMFQTAPGSPLPGGPVTPGLQPFGSQSGGGGFDLPGLLACLTPEQKTASAAAAAAGRRVWRRQPLDQSRRCTFDRTDSPPVDKEALAREARSVLNNIAFRRAIKAIERKRDRARCCAQG